MSFELLVSNIIEQPCTPWPGDAWLCRILPPPFPYNTENDLLTSIAGVLCKDFSIPFFGGY